MAQIATVTCPEFTMDYIRLGSGESSFVIIPGVSVKSVLLSAQALEAGFEEFARRYTVYVFDRKRNLQPGYTVRDMAEDTAKAMQMLGIREAHIFGASQGGMIAQCIAISHPELAGKLYLASTAARLDAKARQVLGRWKALADAGDIRALNRDVFAHVYSAEYRECYRAAFEAMEGDGTPEEMKRFACMVAACDGFSVYDELEKLRCPVFVVGSARDAVLGAQSCAEIAMRLGCPLTIYEGYSHAVYDEAPFFRTQMLNDLLK